MLRLFLLILFSLSCGPLLAQTKLSGADKFNCFQLDPPTQPVETIAACSVFIDTAGAPPLEKLDARVYRAIAYRALGNFEDSESDLLAVLDAEPDHTQTLRMLAWTYREWGRPTDAEEIYTRVLAVDPHWQGWLSRCAVRVDLGLYEAAIQDCAEAEKQWQPDRLNYPLVPYDFAYFTALSLNYLERYDEAYEAAIAYADGKDISGRLYHQAGVALWNGGQNLPALDLVLEGLRLYPEDPDLLDFLSQAGVRQ